MPVPLYAINAQIAKTVTMSVALIHFDDLFQADFARFDLLFECL